MSTQHPTTSPNSKWIWPFEILEQIGEGGMGVVYRARYVVNGRQVALKMLPGDVSDKTALARFERELEVLKTLRHPNIVRCFGGVCEDKRRFYAMELLEEGSLEDRLKEKGKFPWQQVVVYGLQMCAALECSHEKGVVHRDVKPSNFLLASPEQVKLSDFGLASVQAARRITASGKTAGTFLYMAPEQIRGQEITARTDLYALGCVLFELLTGQVPFYGETPGATLHMHCYSPAPRPSEIALDCPIQLERLILKLLEKNPADRPASAAAVAQELREVKETVSVVTPRKDLTQVMPVGLGDRERLAIEGQKLLREMKKKLPWPPWMVATLFGLLALSLLANTLQYQWRDGGGAWRAHWLEAARSPDPEVRAAADRVLGTMAFQNPADVEMLVQALDDSEEKVRIAAAEGLGSAGTNATSALPFLLKVQKTDPSEMVRTAAAESLAQVRAAPIRKQTHRLLWVILLAIVGGSGVLLWRRMRTAD